MSSRSTRITAALIAVTAGAGALVAAPRRADGGGPAAPHTDHHQQPVGNPLAPQGEISDHMREHLTGDFGPIQMALGGALLLQMALSRSLSRGAAFDGDLNSQR